MHVPINVKSPNNISEWQMGFNSAFKGLNNLVSVLKIPQLLEGHSIIYVSPLSKSKKEFSVKLYRLLLTN
jgi:hypothetical protein